MYVIIVFDDQGVKEVIGPFDLARQATDFAKEHTLSDWRVAPLYAPESY